MPLKKASLIATFIILSGSAAHAGDSIPIIAPIPVGKTQALDPLFYYNDLLRRHPDDYVIYYRRGKRREEDNNFVGALQDFRQSLAVNPLKTDEYTKKTDSNQRTMRAWAYQDIGFIYCMQGKFQNGIECFTHAVRLRPAYPDNFQNRGAAYAKLGKMDLAKKDFAQANLIRRTQPKDDCLMVPFSTYMDPAVQRANSAAKPAPTGQNKKRGAQPPD